MPPVSDTKRTAVKGFGWQTFGQFAQNGVQFIASLVFARLLLREEYGVAMVAFTVADFASLLRVSGIAQAFIASPRPSEEIRDTVFWVAQFSGVVYAALLFFGAGWVETVLGAQGLAPLLQLLAVAQLVDGLRVAPFALLMREYRFRDKTIAEAVPFVFGAAVAISLAFVLPEDARIWALASMPVARTAGQAVLFNWYLPVVPRLRFHVGRARELLRASYGILGSNLPSSVLELVPTIAVQQRAGEVAAGAFRVGSNLVVPASRLGHAANYTLFPILARFRDDEQRFRASLLRSMRTVGALSTGLLAWAWVTSPSLVPLLFGEKWRFAAEAARWLSVAAALRVYTYIVTNGLLAVGRDVPSLLIWMCSLAVGIGALYLIPMELGDPAPGAVALTMATATGFLMSITALTVTLKVRVSEALGNLVPALSSVGVGIAAGLVADAGVNQQADWLRFLAVSAAFAAGFLPICGVLLGGGPYSLLSLRGIKQVIQRN